MTIACMADEAEDDTILDAVEAEIEARAAGGFIEQFQNAGHSVRSTSLADLDKVAERREQKQRAGQGSFKLVQFDPSL